MKNRNSHLFSNMSRRHMLKMTAGSAAALSASAMLPGMAHAAGGDIAFWGTGTLDLGDKWARDPKTRASMSFSPITVTIPGRSWPASLQVTPTRSMM